MFRESLISIHSLFSLSFADFVFVVIHTILFNCCHEIWWIKYVLVTYDARYLTNKILMFINLIEATVSSFYSKKYGNKWKPQLNAIFSTLFEKTFHFIIYITKTLADTIKILKLIAKGTCKRMPLYSIETSHGIRWNDIWGHP